MSTPSPEALFAIARAINVSAKQQDECAEWWRLLPAELGLAARLGDEVTRSPFKPAQAEVKPSTGRRL